jgi:D-threonine aldolase
LTGLSELAPEAFVELQTPCLVVDLAAVDRNIRRTEDIASASGLSLRPHFKAHKCMELMLRQPRSGVAVGATCQTVREAVTLVEAGVADVLVANEIVTHQDLELLVAATHRAHIGVAIDSPEHVALLSGGS